MDQVVEVDPSLCKPIFNTPTSKEAACKVVVAPGHLVVVVVLVVAAVLLVVVVEEDHLARAVPEEEEEEVHNSLQQVEAQGAAFPNRTLSTLDQLTLSHHVEEAAVA